jgi:hypothetical protein
MKKIKKMPAALMDWNLQQLIFICGMERKKTPGAFRGGRPA